MMLFDSLVGARSDREWDALSLTGLPEEANV